MAGLQQRQEVVVERLVVPAECRVDHNYILPPYSPFFTRNEWIQTESTSQLLRPSDFKNQKRPHEVEKKGECQNEEPGVVPAGIGGVRREPMAEKEEWEEGLLPLREPS
uniref:Uncharacterized protein n=1 Tax=Globodera rostochiensis TaxID=31243 RepID=A0A914GRA9_GLORO